MKCAVGGHWTERSEGSGWSDSGTRNVATATCCRTARIKNQGLSPIYQHSPTPKKSPLNSVHSPSSHNFHSEPAVPDDFLAQQSHRGPRKKLRLHCELLKADAL